jgi:transposase-like protein
MALSLGTPPNFPERDFFMLTRDDVSAMPDADLGSLLLMLQAEKERRAKAAAKLEKAALSRKAKRDLRCPACHSPLRLDGRRADGVQRYRCPSCGRRFSDASATSLSGSKLTPDKIKSIVAMVMLGSPDWVIAWVCGVDAKTAQYWRDRCLDAAEGWSGESELSGHVWIDEMRFAPTRASGFVDGVWVTYAGRISRDAYMEVAFDSRGRGFCDVYAKLGTPYGSSVERCLEGRVAEGSKLTHDGAHCHNAAIRKLSLGDDWVKYAPGDKEYKAKMAPMNNLCSYLRFNFEKHRGIKFAKLAAYGDLFMYQYFHVRKYGFRATIDYLFSRVCGTKKSHNFRDGFRKTSTW